MRMLKLVAAIALATLLGGSAVATSVQDFDTGVFMSGTIKGSFGTRLNVDIVGSLAAIDLVTGKLIQTTTGCPLGSTCYDFTGGLVTVTEASGIVFQDSISGGIAIRGNHVALIDAVLTSQNPHMTGNATVTFSFAGHSLLTGSGDVAIDNNVVPEPASLLLLGTGLVPLAGWIRWRRLH